MLLVSNDYEYGGYRTFYYAINQSHESLQKRGITPYSDTTLITANYEHIEANGDPADLRVYHVTTNDYRPATPEDLTEYYQKKLAQLEGRLRTYTTLLTQPPNIE